MTPSSHTPCMTVFLAIMLSVLVEAVCRDHQPDGTVAPCIGYCDGNINWKAQYSPCNNSYCVNNCNNTEANLRNWFLYSCVSSEDRTTPIQFSTGYSDDLPCLATTNDISFGIFDNITLPTVCSSDQKLPSGYQESWDMKCTLNQDQKDWNEFLEPRKGIIFRFYYGIFHPADNLATFDHNVTCTLNWDTSKFLNGYLLSLYGNWDTRVTNSVTYPVFIASSCHATPMLSNTPLNKGDTFSQRIDTHGHIGYWPYFISIAIILFLVVGCDLLGRIFVENEQLQKYIETYQKWGKIVLFLSLLEAIATAITIIIQVTTSIQFIFAPIFLSITFIVAIIRMCMLVVSFNSLIARKNVAMAMKITRYIRISVFIGLLFSVLSWTSGWSVGIIPSSLGVIFGFGFIWCCIGPGICQLLCCVFPLASLQYSGALVVKSLSRFGVDEVVLDEVLLPSKGA